jgi:hypothetical protein
MVLAGFVVSAGRRRYDRFRRTRRNVDRITRRLVPGQLPWRLVAALFLVAADLFVILVRHALLEAFQALGDVSQSSS